MEICYSLTEDDLLNFQMYSAGDSKAVKRRLIVGRFVVPAVCVLLGTLFLQDTGTAPAVALFSIAVVFAFGTPAITRWQHKGHFKRHIRDKCQGMLNAEACLRLEAEGLRSSAENTEGVIRYSGIESLGELEALFLIKLKQSLTVLVPKARVSGDPLEAFMAALSEKTGLPVDDHRGKSWAEPVFNK